MLYILCQIPPTPDGLLAPVEAPDLRAAIIQASKNLGVVLHRQIGGLYKDGSNRTFLLITKEINMNLENLANLGQFTGGDTYHVNPIGKLKYTEGVQFLAENANCYWLIDAIGSYQPQLMKIETFRYLQFWELAVHPNRSCTLTCRADSHIAPAVTQEIEFTDFPLPEIKLWVEHGTLILPSEH